MYCAYPVPGMGSNSLMYYYNGKSVSAFFSLEEACVSKHVFHALGGLLGLMEW